MDIRDEQLKNESVYDLSQSFDNIKTEINKMIFDKKELTVIVESFEDRYEISVEEIKGKYLKGKKTRLRNEFVKEVLKYKTMNQVELSEFLGVSYHLVSKIWNDK